MDVSLTARRNPNLTSSPATGAGGHGASCRRIQRRSRPVAVLVGSTELERLQRLSETAHRLAVVLGQDTDLLAQVEAGEAHPAMAAFGLWREVEHLSTLADEIDANREGQPSRAEVAL